MASRKVIISCAITGSIHSPTMSPYLPVTPEEIFGQAIAAAEAGAAILHLHARDPENGRPSADPAVFRRFLPVIKQATDAVINITTGGSAAMTLDERLAAPFKADANDFLYQWDASRDYNPAPGLERVQAALLAINSADDERNPPELGILERELKRIRNGRMYLIPGSEDTRGHGTTGMARLWKQQVEELLRTAPHRTM